MFRVMIADDEKSVIVFLLESVLWDELELEVVGTAPDGKEALSMVREKDIDIAILDIRMPGISGLELCERLRRENNQIQVIIISGYAEFAYAEKAIQYGVIGYCLKPLEYTLVTKYLGKAVQNIKAARHISVKEDLIDVLERQDIAEIQRYLDRLGFSSKSYYVAVFAGERSLDELCKNGISMHIGRGQWEYLFEDDKMSYDQERFFQEDGWQGIGYISEPVKVDEIYGALEECIARSYQFFVEGYGCICEKLDETKANIWLDRVRGAVSDGKGKKLTEILKEIEEDGICDFTVRSSLRLCNLVFSSAAKALYMNPSYVSQLFKKESGITFVQYVNQKRIEDAKEILTLTQKPITDIAIEVGFNDYFYFRC